MQADTCAEMKWQNTATPSVVAMRCWLHWLPDTRRAQEIAWRSWFYLLFLLPVIHTSHMLVQAPEDVAADAKQLLNAGNVTSPASLLCGLISGSLGISYVRKVRLVSIFVAIEIAYFLNVGLYAPRLL